MVKSHYRFCEGTLLSLINDLGIKTDENLSWKEHIHDIAIRSNKANAKAFAHHFYPIFIFSSNDSPSKAIKNVCLSSFRSRNIQIFVIFSLRFHLFQIQNGNESGIFMMS